MAKSKKTLTKPQRFEGHTMKEPIYIIDVARGTVDPLVGIMFF
jgi:hypothetical protein